MSLQQDDCIVNIHQRIIEMVESGYSSNAKSTCRRNIRIIKADLNLFDLINPFCNRVVNPMPGLSCQPADDSIDGVRDPGIDNRRDLFEYMLIGHVACLMGFMIGVGTVLIAV